jgi:hypothetical protein
LVSVCGRSLPSIAEAVLLSRARRVGCARMPGRGGLRRPKRRLISIVMLRPNVIQRLLGRRRSKLRRCGRCGCSDRRVGRPIRHASGFVRVPRHSPRPHSRSGSGKVPFVVGDTVEETPQVAVAVHRDPAASRRISRATWMQRVLRARRSGTASVIVPARAALALAFGSRVRRLPEPVIVAASSAPREVPCSSCELHVEWHDLQLPRRLFDLRYAIAREKSC